MARRALHHKGNMTEYVKVHSLVNPITLLLIGCTFSLILLYWLISPQHVIKSI